MLTARDPSSSTVVVRLKISLFCLILKFCASAEKLHMWVDLFSLVDHFTIGPTFVCIFLDKNWLGELFLLNLVVVVYELAW